MVVWSLPALLLTLYFVLSPTIDSLSSPRPRIVVVGGGISGLTIAHVLQQSGRYNVDVLEAKPRLGGHVRSTEDPMNPHDRLNIGHATHMGMFVNLRLMLRHFHVDEWPVGRGPNDKPGLFRMISVTESGGTFQPPLEDILSVKIWWEALVFYFCSYMNPEQRLDEFLRSQKFSKRFLDIVYWAMATFEFDKQKQEAGEYALGAARALLITQVFFQYLLCDSFEGSLPLQIDQGLKKDLASRVAQLAISEQKKQGLLDCFEELTGDAPLASYLTADYGVAMEKLAAGAGRVWTKATVSHVSKKNGYSVVQTMDGKTIEADAVIFTTHPSIVCHVLNQTDFPTHKNALDRIDSGAVGVRIVHAKDLPFSYPPANGSLYYDMDDPPPILGIFDISELTTSASGHTQKTDMTHAGWLSVAYPVYRNTTLNRHELLLDQVPCVDATVYPWTRATSLFPEARREIVKLQGCDGIYITGQALTGVNKASELQMTNALNLCYEYFDVAPPWKHFFPCPMLPDCNDVDAFTKAKSPLEAAGLAVKSLVGSFLITSTVSRLGVDFFD